MTEIRSSWFSGGKLAIIIYVVLLLLSHLWRAVRSEDYSPESNQQTITVHQVKGDTVLYGDTLNITYRDEYQGDKQNPPIILLLNGNPVGVPEPGAFIKALSYQNRVIAPDFPGFDAPHHQIPDYSMESTSVYMDQVLDSLGVTQVHVVGYSLGAGVGVYMSDRYPGKVESLVMLSGLGVQELELLGSYHLNHAIYGAQLFITWLLHEAVPHFGLLKDVPFNVPYARSFYDSDQRPIRRLLKQYRKPMLIQHGREDGLIPLAAAKEHHRLVPQSKLILYEGGHTIIESETEELAADIDAFIQKVESGRATTYAQVSNQRKQAAQKPFEDVDFARAKGVTLLILMIIIIFSTFVSEDLTCIGAGLLAARGLIGFWPAAVACFLGILIGDIGIFLMGRLLGEPAVRRAPFKWMVSDDDLERSADWFKARGPMIIIGSRFVPGSRFPTYFSAGMIGMNLLMFSLYFVVAALMWTPMLVGIAMLVGTEMMRYFQVYQEYAIWVIPAIILLLFLFVKFILPAVTWRGRRLIVSRWRRLTRWEYWSPYIIYTPVAFYIVYLWIKYGKLTTFTAANPGIPEGGFIGESKSNILEQFKPSGRVAQFEKIPAELNGWEKFIKARAFIREQELDYPITIKPDAGQRGAGVHFPTSPAELKTFLKDIDRDLIIQEYITGREYGIFYYRYPDQERGQILSITDKRLPTLIGDGKHTLEELILKDERAVSLAKYHFKEHHEHLFEIPDEGEKIKLVKLGTHARGAEFGDTTDHTTEQLRQEMDRIASCYQGYYFGRFDVRVPSLQDLKEGNNIKILEVNGVTSETTVIYDSKYSFIDAQKKLMEQWKIAFEIGAINRKGGHAVSPIPTLIKSLINFQHK